MSIQESMLNQMICCLFNDGHVAIEPVQLPCGGTACKQCIVTSNEEVLKCLSCKGHHKKTDLMNIPVNRVAQSIVYSFLDGIFDYVKNTLESTRAAIKGFLYIDN
jgi:hypothetical protein